MFYYTRIFSRALYSFQFTWQSKSNYPKTFWIHFIKRSFFWLPLFKRFLTYKLYKYVIIVDEPKTEFKVPLFLKPIAAKFWTWKNSLKPGLHYAALATISELVSSRVELIQLHTDCHLHLTALPATSSLLHQHSVNLVQLTFSLTLSCLFTHSSETESVFSATLYIIL